MATKANRDRVMVRSFNLLMSSKGLWRKKVSERAAMTIASKDTEDIPRVKDSGKTKLVNGAEVQVMHNGLLVAKGAYQGEWQAEVIEALKGVHEPQEERVFYEVLKRLDPGATIIEQGSWWSYYSLWFLHDVPGSRAICCEPDPTNIRVGKANASLNGYDGTRISFFQSAAGSKDGKIINFRNEDGSMTKVPIRTVDSILHQEKIEKLGILHLDIQGAELEALQGAKGSIDGHKIRFIFISTHHYSISEDPLMHQKCLEFVKQHGGHIVAKHTVLESSSGDGLIVASFDSRDKDLSVNISLQPTDDSLFRPYEYDLGILWNAHDRLVDYSTVLEKENDRVHGEIDQKNQYIKQLEQSLDEITPLRKHLKKSARTRAGSVKRKLKRPKQRV